MTNFDHVEPAFSQALSKRGYTELTPVQNAVLAPELKAADMLVSAQTGSGKTVAFGLAFAPTLLDGAERFSRAGAPLALVIAPTRELALQVQRELEWLYEIAGASSASCVGGMDMRTERRALSRRAHIVVGTPGRLRDHIERGSLDLSEIKAVVLDEADEMLDMGFRDDLEFILKASPDDRRTLMFSATVPKSIAGLAKKYQRNAVRVSTAAEEKQHLDIEYHAYTVAANDRENAIINVLRFYEAKTAIVFCATRATVNRMTSRFNNRGFSVVALSGELSQSQRTHALQAMRDGRARVCIATDVAARGIDLPNLELVVHADLPKNKESLLHRSGRTGRAGRKGTSALIVPHNARKRTERLLNGAKIDATWGNPPSVKDITRRDDERILEDPVLTAAIKDDEQDFAQLILQSFSAEQVSAAFVRLYRAGQSAPEELLDKAPTEREERSRGDHGDSKRGRDGGRKNSREGRDTSKDAFSKGVWFSLSVGRKHTAEARWLLPALIKAGDLQKRDIGAIRIQENNTFFELAPESADKFLEALGPSRKLEKSMSVDRIGDMPQVLQDEAGDAAVAEPRGEKREKPRGKKKRYEADKAKPKRKYGEKSGQIAQDEKALKDILDNAKSDRQDSVHEETKPAKKEDLRRHPASNKRDEFGGRKPKKSKKANKNKGKRSKNAGHSDSPEDFGDFGETQKGPKLKIGKTRKRVNRKNNDSDSSGSAPLKRKT